LCWVFPGLLIVGGWQLVRNENSLTRRSNYLPLGIALLLYYALKLVFIPTLTSYIPLSAWLYLPPSFKEPLRIGIPLLILIVAIFIANRMCKRFNNSMLVFFLSWVAVDGLLTLVFYGVNLLGTY